MSKTVLVPLADGFEEIEAVTVIDVLRRADLEVVTAGIGDPSVARGAHGIDVVPDVGIGDVDGPAIDMIVLPGGMPGAAALQSDPRVQSLIEAVHERGGWTCAICAAPMALGPSGVTAGRTVTSYPGFGERFEHGTYLEERVVVDGRVVTSRSPGTAMEFALTLVEKLVGPEKAGELSRTMLVERPAPAYETR